MPTLYAKTPELLKKSAPNTLIFTIGNAMVCNAAK
tara:strand:+ start:631 stop:735 length:105 start_codon:yes stop_codon:yes gene_type:complete